MRSEFNNMDYFNFEIIDDYWTKQDALEMGKYYIKNSIHQIQTGVITTTESHQAIRSHGSREGLASANLEVATAAGIVTQTGLSRSTVNRILGKQ